jgi:hypothetical protein
LVHCGIVLTWDPFLHKDYPMTTTPAPTPRAALAGIDEHPFETPSEHNSYRLFPDEMEQDPAVFFHGTDRRFSSVDRP